MKHTALSICHEILQEYSCGCYICGERYDEVHHFPKRRKAFDIPEILYVTLFPLCKKCHMSDPNMYDGKYHSIATAGQSVLSRIHIERCNARGLYL
jgi:hypothetical protein